MLEIFTDSNPLRMDDFALPADGARPGRRENEKPRGLRLDFCPITGEELRPPQRKEDNENDS